VLDQGGCSCDLKLEGWLVVVILILVRCLNLQHLSVVRCTYHIYPCWAYMALTTACIEPCHNTEILHQNSRLHSCKSRSHYCLTRAAAGG
jgi:hypothetical protein